MSQLQTTRNEPITVWQTEMKLISGSLKLWHFKNISLRPEMKTHSLYDWCNRWLTNQSWYKNMVWKPTFDVIVSNCGFKSFVFGTRIPKSIRISVFWMRLGAQIVEKSILNIEHFINCILTFSFCLLSLILPKFRNHVFYINFGLTLQPLDNNSI